MPTLRLSSVPAGLLLVLGIAVLAFATGLRPETVGSDTLSYLNYYRMQMQGAASHFQEDFLFKALSDYFVFEGFSERSFFSTIAVINCITLLWFTKRLTDYLNHELNFYRVFFLVFTLLCLSPFFLSAQTNVLRQGMAVFVLFLFYLCLLQRAPIILLLFLGTLAQGFHHTSVFYLPFGLLIYFNYSWVSGLAWALAASYAVGLNRGILHQLLPSLYEKIINYGPLLGYKTGIRYDFLVFSLAAGWLLQWLGARCLSKPHHAPFFNLLKIYWLFTLPFFLLGFGAYSDRYLLPAWIYLSVLVAVFAGYILKTRHPSIYGYYLAFFLSSTFYIMRAQGIIG